MRNIGIAAVALGLALAAPAGAQDRRGSNEVALQITSRGTVRSAPDLVTITVAVPGTGRTAAAATAAAQAKLDTLTRAMAVAGVNPDAISAQPQGAGLLGLLGARDVMVDDESMTGEPSKSTTRTVQVLLPSLAKLQQVQAILAAQDISTVSAPELSLSDERAAKQAAIADAVAKARGEADAYAAAVGYRVARIARVSNTSPQLIDIDQAEFTRKLTTLGTAASDVTTNATVSIDFVIAPR